MRVESGDVSAVVSGAASGLGEAVARMLATAGARVTILDLDEERGARVSAEIGGLFVKTDVSDPASVAAALASSASAHGAARIAVSCAGIAPAVKTVSRGAAHDPAVFRKVIDVNLIGTFNLASQAAAAMTALEPLNDDGERGVIVNTASIAAMDGQIGQLAYAASKAAVAGMTLPMARDLSKLGVRVVAVAPGLFGTPLLLNMDQEIQDALASQIPYPSRFGAPAEFAALVRHIVENPMLNGETIRLDGALRMAPK